MKLTKEEEREMWRRFEIWKKDHPKRKVVDYKGLFWMLVLFLLVITLLGIR